MALNKVLVEEIEDRDCMEDFPTGKPIQPIRTPPKLADEIMAKKLVLDENSIDVSGKLCGICKESLSNYQCPKCGIFYCSLKCYKDQLHVKCSETFFKNEVNQHLSSLSLEDSSARKSKMMKTLKRMHDLGTEGLEEQFHSSPEAFLDSLCDSDDENIYDEDLELASRFQGQNLDELDGDQIWELLGKSHQDKFTSFLESSQKEKSDLKLKHAKLTSILPILEPWWLKKGSDSEKFYSPPLFVEIPPVQLPENVHPSVGLSLLNTLFAYAITYRVLVGEMEPSKHRNMLSQSHLSLDMMISLAPSLLPPKDKNTKQFTTLEELFFHSIQKRSTLAELQAQPKEAFILGWKDLILFTTIPLIQDGTFPDIIATILGQLYSIFGSVSSSSRSYISTCKLVQKKIAFLAQYHKEKSTTALYNKPRTHCRIEELISSIME